LSDSGSRTYATSKGTSFVKGKKGMALAFDGKGDYAELQLNSLINPKDTQFTLCAWVCTELKADKEGRQEQVIMSQKDSNGTGRLWLSIRPDAPESTSMHYDNFMGGRPNAASAQSVRKGKWQHVAVVCNPAERSITYYINGKQNATVHASAFENCIGDLRIGAHKVGKDFWCGKIDDLYVFRGLLTPKEIRLVRNGKLPIY
jgi:hypothetical protein